MSEGAEDPKPEEVEEINTPGTQEEDGEGEGDGDGDSDEGGVLGQMPADMMAMFKSNPAALKAMAAMAGLEGRSSGYIESLPPAVKRRVKALKVLQSEQIKLDVEFEREKEALEAKYHNQKTPLFEKRAAILKGEHEPADEECEWEYDDEDDEDDEAPAAAEEDADGDVKGIPDFWLTALQNAPPIEATIEEHDIDVLKSLEDITLKYEADSIVYTFHFGENEFFTNTTLQKSYFTSIEAQEGDLLYAGSSYDRAEGCTINWKPGKDVTVVEITKRQRKRGGANAGDVRVRKKKEPRESFFRFFSPLAKPTEEQMEQMPEEALDEVTGQMQNDFDLADMLKDFIVPCAVNWFTGDALDDFGDEDDEDDEGGLEGMVGGTDDEEDEDPDWNPPANFDFKGADKPGECKNQ